MEEQKVLERQRLVAEKQIVREWLAKQPLRGQVILFEDLAKGLGVSYQAVDEAAHEAVKEEGCAKINMGGAIVLEQAQELEQPWFNGLDPDVVRGIQAVVQQLREDFQKEMEGHIRLFHPAGAVTIVLGPDKPAPPPPPPPPAFDPANPGPVWGP